MKERKAITMRVQETWRKGIELLERESFKIISVDLDENTHQGNRGSQAVAVVLNSNGEAAWKVGSFKIYISI